MRRPPVPNAAAPEDGPRHFVVQRHRARSLHYDFRLEIDGVLVSWAVPKGVTLDPKARHLAVRVEDHPLEHADFEGAIPAGASGGGDVIVWDRGTWELHGAEDARAAVERGEIHVELFGEKLRGRVVLIRTGPASGERERWLVLHKRDNEAVEGWTPEDHPRSVLSGRTNDEVAADRASSIRDARARAAQRVSELAEVLDSVVESSESANLDDEHDPEGATVGFERAQITTLLGRARDQLSELDDALDRLRRGDYGTCERCGAPIPDARLDARPATRTCLTCASR